VNGEACENCDDGYFNITAGCVTCNAQCDLQQGCSGAGPADCDRCLYVENEGTCVERCPAGRYSVNRVCQDCLNGGNCLLFDVPPVVNISENTALATVIGNVNVTLLPDSIPSLASSIVGSYTVIPLPSPNNRPEVRIRTE
jgi:hypothetical protein